jgi:DHA1 family tetracycline resistance protein-like MFS transporter
LSKRIGEWPLVIVGPLLVTVAMLAFAALCLHAAIGIVVAGIILNATGRSLQTPTLSALISHSSDPRQQGTVFGLFHMLGSLARVIGPIVATLAYTHHHSAPYLMAGGITFAIAVWTIWLRSTVAGAETQRGFEVATESS